MTLHVGERAVSTPSGQEWHVGRRWISRRMPRWRKVRMGRGHAADAAEALTIPDIGGLDDIGAAVLVIAAVVALAVVLVPLLLFGIELIALGLVVAAGILGRILLRRPWVVQATPGEDSAHALTWQVVGWRSSARAIAEVAAALESGLDPAPSEATALLPTKTMD